MKKIAVFPLTLAVAAIALSDASRAEACGGCFVPPSPDVSVVTDHRMAFAITAKQTVLWDQIRYSGDPREFAWVLPVKPGATIELANDEFFSALDASSQPLVYPPQTQNTLGCALTGCSADDSSFAAESQGPNGGVQIIAQSVVGPYDQVTLRSTDNDALVKWLRSNQFAIPTAIEPTIAAYVREQFDFIALKLRPECGQRSMKPVRVVTPGAAPTLPLRLVAAGVGPKVGITLYVISEGRYQPQNFPHVLIPDERLRWDRYQNKSNYEPLSQELMAEANGKTWIIEYADQPQTPTATGWRDPNQIPAKLGRNAGLTSTYYSLCKYWSGNYGRNPNYNPYGSSASSSSGSINVTPCPEPDAGLAKPFDGGVTVSDAGHDAGPSNDGGPDAGEDAGEDAGQGQGDDDDNQQTSSSGYSSSSSSSSSGAYADPADACAYLDDLDTAFEGIAYDNVWVTRMRSILPANALSEGDLLLEPTKLADGRADTSAVSNLHWTPYYADDDLSDDDVKSNCAGSPRHYHRPYASYTALGIFAAAVSIALGRRHRRPRR